ncbi:MAG: VOC family protein [Alphaproteobacteria bacterium]|jgi:catechol 2,3-dioxygenase-like lactoylglutathione lyase family enzyme
MPKLNHIACIAQDPQTVAKFYATIFQMSLERKASSIGLSATAREGYVGLNFNPILPGRPGPAGLDHFGIEVEDIDESFAMATKKYPTVEWVKRSGMRPYAQVGIHDPEGQVVDINQKDLDKNVSEVKTDGLYLEEDRDQERHIEYLALRTLNVEHCAEFYHDVFQMTPLNRQEDDDSYSLTDGRVTLKLMPWKITDYDGVDANRPMLDHIGFRVEDADKVHDEIVDYVGQYPPSNAPCWLLDTRKKDLRRAEMLKKAAPTSKYQYSDSNGVCFVTID